MVCGVEEKREEESRLIGERGGGKREGVRVLGGLLGGGLDWRIAGLRWGGGGRG